MLKICRYLILCLTVLGCTKVVMTAEPHEIAKAEELIGKGVVALREHRLEDAYISFNLALELQQQEGKARGLDGLGCVAFLSGDLDRAEEYYLAALEADQTYHHVYGNMALLYAAKGEYDSAERYYSLALQQQPLNWRFRNNYAALLAANGNYSKARRELKKALTLSPNSQIMQNSVALLNKDLYNKGKYE